MTELEMITCVGKYTFIRKYVIQNEGEAGVKNLMA